MAAAGRVEPKQHKGSRVRAKRELLEAAAVEYERTGEAALNELASAALAYAREVRR